ncbi:MAG: T9SS type A sorting domain-containing protein [Methanobacterium sp.]
MIISTISLNAQWLEKNTGTTCGFAVNSNTIFALGGGVNKSTDGGETWVPSSTGVTGRALVTNGANLFVSSFNIGVYRSTDNANTWALSNTGLPPAKDIMCLGINGTNIYAGTQSNGMYTSSDNGSTWSAINTGLPANCNIKSITTDNSNIYVNTNYGLYFSSNNGNNWTLQSSQQFNVLIKNGSVLFAGSNGVFKSTNNGVTWNNFDNGIVGYGIYSLIIKDTSIFAGTIVSSNTCKIEVSGINSNTWTAVNSGIPGKGYAIALFINGADIFAGTDDVSGSPSPAWCGLWKRPLSEMIAMVGIKEIAKSEVGNSVYPNPTNEKLLISGQHSKVEIMNSLGQLLYSGNDNEIDLSGNNAGIYLVRLSDEEGNVLTKKIIKR